MHAGTDATDLRDWEGLCGLRDLTGEEEEQRNKRNSRNLKGGGEALAGKKAAGRLFQTTAAIMGIIKAVLFFGFVSLVLIALLGPPQSGAKIQRVDQDFLAIGNALKMYASHAGQPPAMAQGLEALVTEPRTSPKPKTWVQVMKMMPADPWGTPYRYALLGPKEREWRWELRSAGPDRVFGNRDDLTGEEECGDYMTLQNGSVESRPSF